MAVNKTVIGDKFGGTTMDIDNVDLTLGTTHKKVERQLNNLLNDPDILNSTAPSAINNDEEGQGSGRAGTSPPSNSSSAGTNTPPPPTRYLQW